MAVTDVRNLERSANANPTTRPSPLGEQPIAITNAEGNLVTVLLGYNTVGFLGQSSVVRLNRLITRLFLFVAEIVETISGRHCSF